MKKILLLFLLFAVFNLAGRAETLPKPVIELLSDGAIRLANMDKYSPNLFAADSQYAACGTQTGGRVVVFVMNYERDAPLQVICNTSSPNAFRRISFFNNRVKTVKLVIIDRLSKQYYESDCLSLSNGATKPCAPILYSSGINPVAVPVGTSKDDLLKIKINNAFGLAYGRTPSVEERTKFFNMLKSADKTEAELIKTLIKRLTDAPTSTSAVSESNQMIERVFQKIGKSGNETQRSLMQQEILVFGSIFSNLSEEWAIRLK